MEIEENKKTLQKIIDGAKAIKEKKGVLVGIMTKEEIEALENLLNAYDATVEKIADQNMQMCVMETTHNQASGHLIQENNELKKENERLRCLLKLTNKNELEDVLKVLKRMLEE